jgi:hypothetical protein
VLLTIPAVALTLQLAYDGLRSIGVTRGVRIVVWAVVGVGLLTCGVLGLHRSAMIQETRTGDLRDRVVAAAEMVRRGDSLLTDQVSPLNAPDIHAPLLAPAKVQRRLPHEAPTADGALDAASTLKVAVARSSFGLPPPREFPLLGRIVQPRDAGPGCRFFRAAPRATLVIPRSRSGAQIALIVSKNVVITRLSTQRYTTAGTAHGVTPGERFYVGTTSFEGDLVVVLPSGRVTLCTGGSAGSGG